VRILIMVKKKIKNKRSILLWVLASSFILLAFVVYQYLFIPWTQKLFYSKFPEIEEIYNVIQPHYKGGNISVNVNWYTDSNQKKTTKRLIVYYRSNKFLGEKDIKYIGKLTCDKLKQIHMNYDSVIVVAYKSLLPFDVPFFHIGETNTYPGKC